MQRFTIYLFSFIIVVFFNTCKTDFDVTAPYKESTIVYGLLSASSDTNWVKINKAYLGDGDAYKMATIPDSINYKDILNVTLEERNSFGTMLKTINLIRDSSIVKEPGIFATSPNILYRTNGIDTIHQNSSYTLIIHNRETGNTVSAKTEVVDSVLILKPLTHQVNFGSSNNTHASFFIQWSPVPEGAVYQLTIRFHYAEVSNLNPSDTLEKYLDWVFPEQTPDNGNFSQLIQYPQFYNFIATQIKANSDLKRFARAEVELIFTVGAKEFYTYIKVNHPPTGANQNIPQYTNVTNGLGIFSSRSEEFSRDTLTLETRMELSTGSITGDLFE